MQYQKEYAYFNSVLSSYLKVNDGYTIKGQVQTLSTQLTNFSKEPCFLEVGIHSILSQPIDKNRVVFITSLIKDKFKFDFELMDIGQLLGYYTKLCETAYFLGCKYYSVYSNLSLAFAYIFIHISARAEQQIQAFLKPFIPCDPAQYQFFNYYFKILESVVVEIDNPRLVIDEEYREVARGKLLAQQYSILVKLNEITTAAWEVEQIDKENIIQCFIEWVTVDYNPQVLNSIPNHLALKKLFQYVQDENQTNVTAECLKRFITHIGKPNEIPQLFQYLGKKMLELLTVVDHFAKNADLSQAEDYLRILVQFCRKSISTFVANFDTTIYEFLRRLAKYTKDEMVDAYQDLVEFWEDFIMELAEHRKKQALSPQATLLVEEVYEAVCQQCHYSLKLILELNSRPESRLYEINRNGEDIYGRRMNSDTIFSKICLYYGKVPYLEMVYSKIQAISTKSQQFLWPYLEVYLFSLSQSIYNMESNCKQVTNIISIYIQLTRKQNFAIPTLLSKSFLGIFRALMTVQEKDVEFIKLLFNLTSTCFENVLLMPYAEKTFEVGCEHNYAIMKNNFEDMATLIQKYPNSESIVKGIIYLIYKYEDLAQKYLPNILSYLFQLLQTASTPESRVYHKELMYSLTAVIKVLQDVASDNKTYITIITHFTRHIFPYVLETLKNPKRVNNDQDHQVQRMVRLVKTIMRYIKFDFTEFINPLYSSVLQAFTVYPICSYAYLVEVAITVFYGVQEYSEYFKGVYVKFCQALFVHMNQISKMDQYCYLLDDFIGISRRFFLYNASIVLNSGQLPNIIDLCTNAFIGSNTPRIAKAAYNFFETIFMVYWRTELIEEHNARVPEQKFTKKVENEQLYYQLRVLLAEKLQHIVGRILQHLSQAPQESTREEILFTLLSQVKAFPEENCLLWPKILAQLPLDILVPNEKARFMANLQLTKSADFEVVRQATRFIKRYFILINKRMVNSNNRKFKFG